MKTLFYIYIFLPFAKSLTVFLRQDASDRFHQSKTIVAGLILVIYSIYFPSMLSLSGQDHFSLGQENGYLGLTFKFKVDPLNSFLICVNTIMLFLVSFSIIGRKDYKKDIFNIFISSFIVALANGAMLADSLYTFFIFGELIFLIGYIYHCRISKNETLVVMRYSGFIASLILIIVMLYLKKSNSSLDLSEMSFLNLKKEDGAISTSFMLWGMMLYFLIKLLLFPFLPNKKNISKSLNIVNDFLIPQTIFILFIYNLKKYVIDVFPETLKEYSSPMISCCAIGYVIFNLFAFRSRSILQQQLLIRKGIVLLILGAFLGFNNSANIGGFILLTGQSFALLAFYIVSSSDLFQSPKGMRNGIILLAAVLCALNCFPLTGSFIGLYKIITGHQGAHISLLILIFLGLLLSLFTSVRWFLLFTNDKNMHTRNLISNKHVCCHCSCLLNRHHVFGNSYKGPR